MWLKGLSFYTSYKHSILCGMQSNTDNQPLPPQLHWNRPHVHLHVWRSVIIKNQHITYQDFNSSDGAWCSSNSTPLINSLMQIPEAERSNQLTWKNCSSFSRLQKKGCLRTLSAEGLLWGSMLTICSIRSLATMSSKMIAQECDYTSYTHTSGCFLSKLR